MSRVLRLATCAATAVACCLVATPVAVGAPSPMTGHWESVDAGDESEQELLIGGGGPGDTVRVTYIDWGASVFGTDPTGEPLYGGAGRDWGVIEGNTVTTTFSFRILGSGRVSIDDVLMICEYDPSSDTISDNWGTVWHRQ